MLVALKRPQTTGPQGVVGRAERRVQREVSGSSLHDFTGAVASELWAVPRCCPQWPLRAEARRCEVQLVLYLLTYLLMPLCVTCSLMCVPLMYVHVLCKTSDTCDNPRPAAPWCSMLRLTHTSRARWLCSSWRGAGLWHPDPLALQSPERPGGASRTSQDGENYARQTAGKSGGQNTNDGNATSKLVLADHLFECSLPPLLMPCYPRARLHP